MKVVCSVRSVASRALSDEPGLDQRTINMTRMRCRCGIATLNLCGSGSGLLVRRLQKSDLVSHLLTCQSACGMEQILVRNRMEGKGINGTNFPSREGYRRRPLRLDPLPVAITMRCENRAERLGHPHAFTLPP